MTPLNKPVVRKTRDTLGWGYGCDTGRSLVIKLDSSSDGDTLTIRPHGTRRSETVRIEDIYHWAIRSRCLAKRLEKARATKAAKRLKEEAKELKRRINRIGK
jgi:CRISPR/Cas system-associated protein Csx1